jgi:hypothetical protein
VRLLFKPRTPPVQSVRAVLLVVKPS